MTNSPIRSVLIEELRDLHTQLNHPPNAPEIDLYSQHTVREYRREFGTIDKALEATGLNSVRELIPTESIEQLPNIVSPAGHIPSHTELLQDLFATIDTVGQTPTKENIEQFGMFRLDDYTAQFGSIANAHERVKEAYTGEYYKTETLLTALQDLYAHFNRPPLLWDLVRYGHPVIKYKVRIQSWGEVQRNLPIDEGFTLPTEDLLTHLRETATTIGSTPTAEQFQEHAQISHLPLIRRFGNWTAALIAADLNTTESVEHPSFPNTAQDLHIEALLRVEHEFGHKPVLLDEVHRIAYELKSPPRPDEIERYSIFNYDLYLSHFGSWSAVLKEAGYDPATITWDNDPDEHRKRLLTEIKHHAIRKHKLPKPEDITTESRYSPATYIAEFGSWADTLCQVPADLNALTKLRKEILESELKRLANELGHPPTKDDIISFSTYPQELTNAFPDWSTALSAVDMSLFQIPPDHDQSDHHKTLIQTLTDFGNQSDKPPTQADITTHHTISLESYLGHFGSWNTALETAGFENKDAVPKSRHFDGELLIELWHLHQAYGSLTPELVAAEAENTPSQAELNASWDELITAAGLTTITGQTKRNKSLSNEDICQEIRRVAATITAIPVQADLRQHATIPVAAILARFDSIGSAVHHAGFTDEATDLTHQSHQKSHVVSEIRRVTAEIGHPPTKAEMTTHGAMSGNVAANQFDGWFNALRRSGLDPNNRETERGNPKSTPKSVEPSRSDLLQELKIIDGNTQHQLSTGIIDSGSQYRVDIYLAEFGSLTGAIEASDIDIKKQLIKDIRNVADIIHGKPTTDQINEHGIHSADAHLDHFGDWDTALHAAGILPGNNIVHVEEKRTELIVELRRLDQEWSTIDRKLIYSVSDIHPSEFTEEFGSFDAALAASGVTDTTSETKSSESNTTETALDRAIRKAGLDTSNSSEK